MKSIIRELVAFACYCASTMLAFANVCAWFIGISDFHHGIYVMLWAVWLFLAGNKLESK